MGRVILVIERIEALVMTAAMIGMAAVTIVNVFARNLFGGNLAAAEEINQFLIVLICFAGIGYAASRGRHIRMTALYDQLGPRGRKGLMVAIAFGTAGLMLAFAWYALGYALSVERVSPVLGLPLRRIYLVAPVGFLLAGVQYLLTGVRNLVSEEVFVAFDVRDGYEAGEGPEPAD